MYLYFHKHEINLGSLMLLYFPLLYSCYFVICLTKMHEKTLPSNSNNNHYSDAS